MSLITRKGGFVRTTESSNSWTRFIILCQDSKWVFFVGAGFHIGYGTILGWIVNGPLAAVLLIMALVGFLSQRNDVKPKKFSPPYFGTVGLDQKNDSELTYKEFFDEIEAMVEKLERDRLKDKEWYEERKRWSNGAGAPSFLADTHNQTFYYCVTQIVDEFKNRITHDTRGY